MATTAASPIPAEPVAARADRRTARMRVYALVRAAQVDGGLTASHVHDLIEEGERRGWPDVVKLGMYLGIMCCRYIEHTAGAEWIEALLARATADEDAVSMALALAVRSQNFDDGSGDGRAPVDADRDLARAAVLLEGWSGPSSEAVSAHIECARSCEHRDLWELQLRHYDAAEACLDFDEGGADRLPVLLYNRAEVEVNWVAATRERGCCAEVPERAQSARAALLAADVPAMPASWREDLAIFRELVDSISPPPGGARAPTRPDDREFAGYMHLTRAFAAAPSPQARAHVTQAIERIDHVDQSRMYLLSLALAVELEAAQAGGETAGLRWGRELVERRWDRRLATLASMESLIAVERLHAEHELLQQHAYLDDLTGLANRRALVRFIDGLRTRGVRTVAVALIDLDRFKSINDSYGHAVGDEALSRTADILRGGVRDQDLVVRLGGDEFLVLLNLSDEDAAHRRCETIVDAIARAPWSEVCDGLRVRASLGIAFGTVADFDAICAEADAALYRAKQAGGGAVAV